MSISCILSDNDHEKAFDKLPGTNRRRRAQEGEKRIRLDWKSLSKSDNAEALTVVLDTYTIKANTRKFMEPEARQKLLNLDHSISYTEWQRVCNEPRTLQRSHRGICCLSLAMRG